jgi:putative integral membrane protein (TIGR02587 family)
MASTAQAKPGPWEKEFDDLARGLSGAFIFGMPLLFTMEMWWIGTFTEPWKLFLILGLGFGVNVMLAYFAGFRDENTFFDNLAQAAEAMALGAVASTIVLLTLNQLQLGDPLDATLGKIIVQTMPLSIGASAAKALFGRGGGGGGESGGGEGGEGEKKPESSPWRVALYDLGKTVGGALFIGFSVAPTEEIPKLATELDYWHELGLVALTLILTYLIVFESGFSKQHGGDQEVKGPFHRPITETSFAYIVSLLVALVALYLFSQVKFGDPLASVLSETLVLGLPAAIGGAAGRALL